MTTPPVPQWAVDAAKECAESTTSALYCHIDYSKDDEHVQTLARIIAAHAPQGSEDGARLASDNATLRRLLREQQDKSMTTEALNLLCVMRPIDWAFVFSAPMNGKQNAEAIETALADLERAFTRNALIDAARKKDL